jgi:hypothetical protein
MRSRVIVFACFLASMAYSALAQAPELPIPPSCKVLYSMVTEDSLHNINQGLLASGFKEKDGFKWLEKMYKKYPDVCYVAPNTRESIVFFIIATPAVYHGTQIRTQTHNTESTTSGTVRDDDGNRANIDATTTGTTTSSVAVPYEVEYNSFTLTVERKAPDAAFEALRRFRVDGLYNTAYGFSWGKGKHPIQNVMEDAIKWIHEGGLSNPQQTISK